MVPTAVRRVRFCCLALLAFAGAAQAAWIDPRWPFRRPVDVTWDDQRAGGDDLAVAEFYTAGHHKPNGEDIRVATEEGRIMPSRVLMIGPGDRVRVAFQLARTVRKYYAYFGHPEPPAVTTPELPWRRGLLMEMRQFTGGQVENFEQITASYERSQPLIGRTVIDRPFLGINPFGEHPQTIAKISGTLYCPMDAEYLFAASADDRAALFIDGKPLVFALHVPDIRFNAKVRLARGPHEFVFYHLNNGGDGRFSVVWTASTPADIKPIPRESFGICYSGVVGAMEELRKDLTADFKVEYLAEAFIEGHYTHRVRFTAHPPKMTSNPTHEWDLGDGQTRTGETFEHVYVNDGVYPVRLTMRLPIATDTQTTQIDVRRNYDWMVRHQEEIGRTPVDEPAVHAKIVAGHNVSKMPLGSLAWATRLHVRGKQLDAAMKVAERLAAEPVLPDPDAALAALKELSAAAFEQNRAPQLMSVWNRVPKESNLNPRAAKQHALYLLWWTADFARAVEVLEPFAAAQDTDASDDVTVQRLYGQALILSQRAEQGATILREVPAEGRPERQAVISGAMARTVEHFIGEKDWEFGEQAWERWQAKYPTDFLEGYSVLLRTRLMELRGAGAAAAKVAEAFATAVPQSSYSPKLLDRASRLLVSVDSSKAHSLRQLLKQRYPEDPLSQGP